MSKRKYTFDEVPNSALRSAILEWIKNDLHQEMADLYYIHGETLDGVAERFNFSTSRARDILRNCGKRLSQHLPAAQ